MLQNIIVISIIVIAVILLIRHFLKGKCTCSDSGNSKGSCSSSCSGCNSKDKK